MLPIRQTYMRVRKFQKSAKELSPVDSTQEYLGGWLNGFLTLTATEQGTDSLLRSLLVGQ